MQKHSITLTTLNARYSHAALGLRYLKANLGPYSQDCIIEEFTIQARPLDVVESLLKHCPSIVGISVYIWNRLETMAVLKVLKQLSPQTVIVLGGPEVSHSNESDPLVELSDFTIQGWGELSFQGLCHALAKGEGSQWPKIIDGARPALDTLILPYGEYNDEDIANRSLYVEASRGCPFKCEFCLSSLDETAWPFPLPNVLAALDELYARGARNFRFVDRTFNLRSDISSAILDFFLLRLHDKLSLHFELVPDKLPTKLREKIALFPPGVLQLEVGIQSFDPQVQARISRRQNNQKARDNLIWLRQHSHAHLHTDLIFGLPGEGLEQFADSFDQLVALNPHEIQLGLLKLLPGTPIARHNEKHHMIYDSTPPYRVLSTDCVDFATVQRIERMARHWDLIANSGRFQTLLPIILGQSPFNRFLELSDWLHSRTLSARGLSPATLFKLLSQPSQLPIAVNPSTYADARLADLQQFQQKDRSGHKTTLINNRQTRHVELQSHSVTAKDAP